MTLPAVARLISHRAGQFTENFDAVLASTRITAVKIPAPEPSREGLLREILGPSS